jgi:energy-coupling factor transporter ATP-binding protein EcfA2
MSISRRQFILGTAAGLGLPPNLSKAFDSYQNTSDTLIEAKRPGHAFLRFDEIHLKNYGVFSDSNSFNFNEDRTVIVLGNGSGKTTLFNALARLGPDPAVQANIYSDNVDLSVEVLTQGDRDLVTKYRQLIFVHAESARFLANEPDEAARDLCYGQDTNELKDAAWQFFRHLVDRHSFYGPGHYPRLEESRGWSVGEKLLYGYAMVVAARSRLNVDLPLVLDAPFSSLDDDYREGLTDYFDSLTGQQIMLTSPYDVGRRYDVDYRLPDRDLRVFPLYKDPRAGNVKSPLGSASKYCCLNNPVH